MMRVVLALAAVLASAHATIRGAMVEFSNPVGGNMTNVCNLVWSYCPRDPGCITYDSTVSSITVFAPHYSSPVKAEDLKAGDELIVQVEGDTTMKSVPAEGSYKIYSLEGKNMGAGPLDGVMEISDGKFTLTLDITLTSDAFSGAPDNWFEFGIDVFREASGTLESFCMQVSDVEYNAAMKAKITPPYELYCKPEPPAHWVKGDTPIEGHPIPSAECGTPPPPKDQCSLFWNYCPRDPGCKTYDCSVTHVEVDVMDKKEIKAGDVIHLKVNGTTQMTSVPSAGSYKVYSLSGKNQGAGPLTDVMTISDCGSKGCHFYMDVTFTLQDDSFNSAEGWMEFGLDVFREKSGTLESFCIEVENPAYKDYEETHPQPPPGFDMLCTDDGWGHFTSVPAGVPEHPQAAVCKLV